jgi:hypothetical protein
MTAYGNCSKNYINCRKHPVRTGSADSRVQEDVKAYLKKLENQRDDLREIFAKADAKDPSVTAGALKKADKAAQEISDQEIALQSHTFFTDWTKKQEREMTKLKASMKPTTNARKYVNKITQLREDLLTDMKSNVEKEIALEKAAQKPLEGFKLAVANLLVEEGDAYDTSGSTWGDSRGRSDYTARSHIQEDCKPAIIKNYEENYSWNLYDTYNSQDYVGIKADMSCACGQVHNRTFIMENASFQSMMSKLMNS